MPGGAIVDKHRMRAGRNGRASCLSSSAEKSVRVMVIVIGPPSKRIKRFRESQHNALRNLNRTSQQF
jgi:hypothetical protein